jgi:hypothetical protein
LVEHGKPGDLPRFELAHEVPREIFYNAKEVDMKELNGAVFAPIKS